MSEDMMKLEALKNKMQSDCDRVRKLSTLPEKDRTGKYRKAIDELFAGLKKAVSQFLMLSAAGGIMAPTSDPAFRSAWLDGWFAEGGVKKLVEQARQATYIGDYEALMEIGHQLRRESLDICKEFGGYEELWKA